MRSFRGLVVLASLVSLAACSALEPGAPSGTVQAEPVACTPVAPQDPLVGNWLSVSAQKGVAGSLRTLYTLNADGTMAYVEQIKRPRAPSQGLHESGCWQHDGSTLILRTQESNGLPVNPDDPIYVNRFRVLGVRADELHLQGAQGPSIRAKRMADGYRLPF